jgi:hypothetical protein
MACRIHQVAYVANGYPLPGSGPPGFCVVPAGVPRGQVLAELGVEIGDEHGLAAVPGADAGGHDPGPGPGGRLERVLRQVGGQFPVAVGVHAGVPEQPPVVRGEAAELSDVAPRILASLDSNTPV